MKRCTTVVRKVGNSLVMGIPRKLRSQMRIEQGMEFELSTKGGDLIATPIYNESVEDIPDNATDAELIQLALESADKLSMTPENGRLTNILKRLKSSTEHKNNNDESS